MSMSDSDTSSQGGSKYKNLRQVSRDRLFEMLRMAKKGDSESTWKVLIVDKVTLKIISCLCKMEDISSDERVSLVEDINKRREPMRNRDAIYYIQPTKENVEMFLSDMAKKNPLYKRAFIFFSSPVSWELVTKIKSDSSVLSRICALKEMNLEYFPIDRQGFITNNERAFDLFGDEESTRKADLCLNEMASRVATVFASLGEFPFVRYRAAKYLDPTTMTTFRDLIPTKLAAGIWNCLLNYKTRLPNFPATETCELLILDRSIDQIAPIIHEWTYDAMCHDLLNMEGNKYVHEVSSTTGGVPEKKEVLLEDHHDPVYLEFRHSHIADVSERLHEMMTILLKIDEKMTIHRRNGGEVSIRDLQKIAQDATQYCEQKAKLSLHLDIAVKIDKSIKDLGLKELGQLEQDLVFGDAGTKEITNFLKMKPDMARENKLRLLMIYAATHPEKFEGDSIPKIMELANLPSDDASAVYNMKFLKASSDSKKSSTFSFLKFYKKKHALRKDRIDEVVPWKLSRFYPMIEELIEKLSKNELPKNDYPCMNDPCPTFNGTSQPLPRMVQVAPVHSVRTKRPPTWARPRNSDDGYSSDSVSSSDFKKMGPRIFVFIVGGATRSELRVCHKLTTKLKREIILGSSSLVDPQQFITKLKLMKEHELSLDDLEI